MSVLKYHSEPGPTACWSSHAVSSRLQRGCSPAVIGQPSPLARIIAGLFAKRAGVNLLVQGSLVAALLGAVLLVWNPSEVANLLAVALIGFAIAPIFPALMSGTSQRVGAHFAANTIGLQMAAAGLGTAVIPSLLGVLARQFSLEIVPDLLGSGVPWIVWIVSIVHDDNEAISGKCSMKIQSLAGAWKFRQAGTQEWLPASVPGGVHTDLLALGRIPDPFVGDNEKRVQWVAEADWEYHNRFYCRARSITQAAYLAGLRWAGYAGNRQPEWPRIGSAPDNMFRQYRWDVKPLLRAGENDLHIAFSSPVRFAAAQQAARPLPGVPQAIPGGPYLRKAPCQFGWDWGPQLPPIGIWKDIRLEGYEGARITEVHLRQKHGKDQVSGRSAGNHSELG